MKFRNTSSFLIYKTLPFCVIFYQARVGGGVKVRLVFMFIASHYFLGNYFCSIERNFILETMYSAIEHSVDMALYKYYILLLLKLFSIYRLEITIGTIRKEMDSTFVDPKL